MITYSEVFDRAMEDNNYPAVMQIDYLVDKDLDAAFEEYQAAITVWESVNAKQVNSTDGYYDYALDVAYLEMQRKYVTYLEKQILHSRYRGLYNFRAKKNVG